MTDKTNPPYPKEFLERLNAVKNRRARAVIDHILKYGSVSTEELKDIYGYNHPPRAAKEVRDEGIPLQTFRIRSSDGRTIAAYRFGDPASIITGREGGRRQFSRRFKQDLYDQSGGKCSIGNGQFALRELQIDHRIPYEIAGDLETIESIPDTYMLVCGSCNRAKSWSCEHCPNWIAKDVTVCQTCYWANPNQHKHVATASVRRADLIWQDQEVDVYDELRNAARAKTLSVQEYIKRLLRGFLFFHW